jgi:hypothetical protein
VQTIGDEAFKGPGNQLTAVTIPNSVTTIGNYAFKDNAITALSIGTGVTSIGTYAFANNALTTVTIPNNVTTIGTGAFDGCTNLATINCRTTSTAFGADGLVGIPEEQVIIHARTTDGTWTASEVGAFDQNIAGGNLIQVIKDLT